MREKFFLRPLKEENTARMLEWMKDADVMRYLRINGDKMTIEDVRNFIREASDETQNLHRAANKGDKLFFSVPYDTGLGIRLNGKTIQAERFADYLMTISLTDGSNEIEIEYHVSGHPLGVGLTYLGAVSLVGIICLRKRNCRANCNRKRQRRKMHDPI